MKKYIGFIIFELILILFTYPAAAQDDYHIALENIYKIIRIDGQEEITKIADEFNVLPNTDNIDTATIKHLIEDKEILKWSTSLDDFLSIADILFADLPFNRQQAFQKLFEDSKKILYEMKSSINNYALKIHPEFKFLNIPHSAFTGRGIHIAVVDVFEKEKLVTQRKLYPQAKIAELRNFGNPVQLSHGNTVIDLILRIAPEAEILPISFDAKSSVHAIRFISANEDIDIVNMSRAFSKDNYSKNLEPEFKKTLLDLIQKKILCKSLGNTGTDFNNHLNARRLRLGLGPINNMFAYDLELIKDVFSDEQQDDLLIFGENLAPFADDMALSATVPGSEIAIQKRTFSLPAEGVWSPSTATFESGSSFAAPQLAALSALLLEADRALAPRLTKVEHEKNVVLSLKKSTTLLTHSAEDWGLGLPDLTQAFQYLNR